MKKVFKYPVGVESLPVGSTVLFGGMQGAEYFIWAEVDTSERQEMLFDCQVYGTGQVIESNAYTYLNSIFEGPFVWHFYWRWMP